MLQTYSTDESLWPINKPVPKIEGQSQCTGEAEYVADIAPTKGEVHAAFVTTTIANCDLDVVDPSEALVIIFRKLQNYPKYTWVAVSVTAPLLGLPLHPLHQACKAVLLKALHTVFL